MPESQLWVRGGEDFPLEAIRSEDASWERALQEHSYVVALVIQDRKDAYRGTPERGSVYLEG